MPGETLNVVGDRPARVYEGLECLQYFAPPKSHRSNFQNGVPFGVETGGLQVQGNVDLFERRNHLVQSVDAAASHLDGFNMDRYGGPGSDPAAVLLLRASASGILFRCAAADP